MSPLLALALLLQDESPFAPEAKYHAKITFEDGSLLWVKGAKYRFDLTLRRQKGVIVHDGESTFATEAGTKNATKSPSVTAALEKLWKSADTSEKEAVRKNIADYVFDPVMRDWYKIDGKKFKRSDGGKILDKETELVEATAGPALKFWRVKGTQVVIKLSVMGTLFNPKSIDESADVPDTTFKAPEGYTVKEDEGSAKEDAALLWKQLKK